MTFTEWEDILRIMEFKLGGDSFTRKFAGQTVTLREDFAIRTALTQMLGSQEFYELWKANAILDPTFISQIDTNARFFIAGSGTLTLNDQVVPRMPDTSLSLDEIALIEKIITL